MVGNHRHLDQLGPSHNHLSFFILHKFIVGCGLVLSRPPLGLTVVGSSHMSHSRVHSGHGKHSEFGQAAEHQKGGKGYGIRSVPCPPMAVEYCGQFPSVQSSSRHQESELRRHLDPVTYPTRGSHDF